MTTRRHDGSVNRWCQATALSACCRAASHPVACVAVAAVATVLLSWQELAMSAGAVLTAILAAIVGSEARLRASTLSSAIKFGYRRVVIRHRWRHVMESAGLHAPKANHDDAWRPAIPKLRRKMVPTPVGVIVNMRGSLPRQHVIVGFTELRDKFPKLKTGFKARDVVLRPSQDTSDVGIMLIFDDPFKRPISKNQLPPASAPGLLVTGIDQDGLPAEKSIYLSELLGGTSGSGKSSEVWARLAALTEMDIPFALYVYDNKGGAEFHNLADKAYVYEARDFSKLLQKCMDDLADAQDRLNAIGARSAPTDSPDFPVSVLLIDELVAAVIGGNKSKSVKFRGNSVKLLDAVVIYAVEGRATNMMVLACAQIVQKEVLGMLRSVLPIKTMLWADDDDMVRMLGFDPKEHPAHMVPKTKKYAGIGWMQTDERGIVKYRGAYLDDAERDAVAEKIGDMTNYLRNHKSEKENVNV